MARLVVSNYLKPKQVISFHPFGETGPLSKLKYFIARRTMSTSDRLKEPSNCNNVESVDQTYKNAIRKLNGLQSNASLLKHIRQNSPVPAEETLKSSIRDLERSGMTLEQLDSQNVIHVAGTKGKGMTCAYVESILRLAGFRTGFFSSPHLITVRERIKINGKPLSQEQFTKYFFTVYDNLLSTRKDENDMPPYFKFLTCMAYYTLFHEKVDVAIIEVGIGGAGDSTNIVRNPIVTAITTLGLEHQFILGKTLEEITLAKAGIMKKGVPCFTVNNHPPHILEILRKHAERVSCQIYVCPDFESYGSNIELSIDDGFASRLNASVAVQTTNAFLSRVKSPNKIHEALQRRTTDFGKPFQLENYYKEGLKHCTWYGRYQVYHYNELLTFYLDGAHTDDSLILARNWYFSISNEHSFRILVFYITGDRDAEKLLKPFAQSESRKFDLVIFCPLSIKTPSGRRSPSEDTWSALGSGVDALESCRVFDKVWKEVHHSCESLILNSVTETVLFLEQLSNGDTDQGTHELQALPNPQQEIKVLVTGSLYLVGTFLSVLDPEITVR